MKLEILIKIDVEESEGHDAFDVASTISEALGNPAIQDEIFAGSDHEIILGDASVIRAEFVPS